MIKISEKNINNSSTQFDWNQILSKCKTFDLSQEHIYILLWWRFYRNEVIAKKLLLYLNTNIGNGSIWPLMLRRQFSLSGVYSIGQIDGFITDYALPVIENSTMFLKTIKEIIGEFENEKIKWNFFKLNLPLWANYLDILNDKNELGDLLYITKEFDKYTFIELKNSFEDYLSILGSKTRADIRKYLRIFNQGNFSFQIIDDREQMIDTLPELIRLNKTNWSVFDKTKNIDFISEIIKESDKFSQGNVFLAKLAYGDNSIAIVFGFINNEKCFLHTAGVSREKIQSLSPGITLYALLIQELFDRNISLLDLSPGIEEYKIRLNAKVDTVTQIVFFRNNFSKLIYIAGQKLVRFLKRFKDR